MRIIDPYDERANAETFDWEGFLVDRLAFLQDIPDDLHPAVRVRVTRDDPLLFALIYLRHHLTSPDTGRISFSDMHLDLFRHGRRWAERASRPAEFRDAYIAPRNSGKSTMLFLILPMWAAAHGHVRFLAAFADSAAQAELHLATFRRELDTNQALQRDFPEFCARKARTRDQQKLADRQEMMWTASGFVFVARGIDTSSLGMKVGELRPDLILLDDIEKDESSYSAYQAEKRLTTVLDAILPMSLYARVVLVGTTTMPGSIIHQLVRHGAGEKTEAWIEDEGFRVHHYRAIVKRDDGTERSIWPEKWSIDYLQSIRHTRNYAKNYECDPMAADGAYWTVDDFRYGTLESTTRTCITVDPAITSREKSDQTGIAVVSWQPPSKESPRYGRVVVRHAEGVRLDPKSLRNHLAALLVRFPETRVIIVEANQGGDAWLAILHDLPVKVVTQHSAEPKEVRAARALNHYQEGRVLHEKRFFEAEAQMIAFPKVAHDDMVDAVSAGVLHHLNKPARRKVRVRNASYV